MTKSKKKKKILPYRVLGLMHILEKQIEKEKKKKIEKTKNTLK